MLRLRPYKSCDADLIAEWIKDENVFKKWGGERFGDYPISADIIDEKYSKNNGDCVEPDNFYPWTAIDDDNRAVGHFIMRYTGGGLMFGCVYAVMILLVYFAQTTAVKNDALNEQAVQILDFSRGGLLFSYDLLGYGMMALSTFFIGLTIKPVNNKDRWLKYLMTIHGIFFFGCLIMPMTGIFSASMSDGSDSIGGIIALEFWCAYFLPIGILSGLHFREEQNG